MEENIIDLILHNEKENELIYHSKNLLNMKFMKIPLFLYNDLQHVILQITCFSKTRCEFEYQDNYNNSEIILKEKEEFISYLNDDLAYELNSFIILLKNNSNYDKIKITINIYYGTVDYEIYSIYVNNQKEIISNIKNKTTFNYYHNTIELTIDKQINNNFFYALLIKIKNNKSKYLIEYNYIKNEQKELKIWPELLK